MTHRFKQLDALWPTMRKALILGGARQKLKVPDELKPPGSSDGSLLNLLAVLSVRQRFAQNTKPESLINFDARGKRPNVPERKIRDLLCSLFAARNSYTTDAVPLAALDGLVRAGLSPHPYDFHVLEHWLKLDPETSGSAAKRWLKASHTDTNANTCEDFDDEWEHIDDTNWQDLPISLAVQYVRDKRLADTAAGRQLCIDTLQDHTAANRVKLLDALTTGLSTDDVEYLNNCLEDRAASVRTQVTRLLALIKGTTQHSSRLENAAAALSVAKKNKLVGQGIQVNVSVPKSIGKARRTLWIEELFNDVDPVALSEYLELKPANFCKGIGDPVLRSTLALNALAYGHTELTATLVRDLDLRRRTNITTSPALAKLDSGQKTQAWPMLLKDLKLKSIEELHWILSSAYVGLRTKPDAAFFSSLLSNKHWKKYLKAIKSDADSGDPEVIELITILTPAEARTAWEETLNTLSPAVASRARRLNQLFQLLEYSN